MTVSPSPNEVMKASRCGIVSSVAAQAVVGLALGLGWESWCVDIINVILIGVAIR